MTQQYLNHVLQHLLKQVEQLNIYIWTFLSVSGSLPKFTFWNADEPVLSRDNTYVLCPSYFCFWISSTHKKKMEQSYQPYTSANQWH